MSSGIWQKRAATLSTPGSAAPTTAETLIPDPAPRERARWLRLLGKIGARDAQAKGKEFASSAASVPESGERPTAAAPPTQLYFGYLAGVTRRDATHYAIGVAHRNAVNVLNAVYGVFAWQGGWAYEVHEGGSKLALLPGILRYFDQQPGADLDTLVVHLHTAQRVVKVQRTRAGVAAFLMPEGFSAEQTPSVERGASLAPAVALHSGVLATGVVLFATGFLAMILALWRRPDPPPLPNADHDPIRYEQLPISQWPALLNAAAAGYVDSLEYSAGQWKINRGASGLPSPASTADPPLHTPIPASTP